jgi:addiction module HigA family antidote
MATQTIRVPGTVLKEQYLDKYGIPVSKLSVDIGLSPSAIRQLINGRLKISLEIALKLERYFEKPVKYWIDLQNTYSLAELAKDTEFQEALKRIPTAQKVPVPKKAADKAAAKKAPVQNGTKTAGRKPAARKPAETTPARKPRARRKPQDSSFD